MRVMMKAATTPAQPVPNAPSAAECSSVSNSVFSVPSSGAASDWRPVCIAACCSGCSAGSARSSLRSSAVGSSRLGASSSLVMRGLYPPPPRLRRDQLVALGRHALEQILERVGELLHALPLEHGGHVVVVDPGFGELVDQRVRLVKPLRDRVAAHLA